MAATENITAAAASFSCNDISEAATPVPGWQKCLACSDYGVSCNGPSLGSLGNIDSVRSFHKAMRKARKIQIKAIVDAAPHISESTINEYFSNIVKDYKWTTVSAIDTAMACICGNRVGSMPLDNTCPASSSDIRSQIAAAELKIAAAELKAAQFEHDAAAVSQRLVAVKAKHIAQLAALESNHAKDMDWMKNEVKLWRRLAFILMGLGVLIVALLVFYLTIDIMNPATGLIRY